VLKLFLIPVSWIYGFVTAFRNWLYDFKLLKTNEFDVPIISVGNITVGGTGKTPHTEYLIKLLKTQFRVATLSRGYKRKTSGFRKVEVSSDVTDVGDEPLQIKRKFPSVTVAVCEDRVEGVRQLLDEDPLTDVVLLDDAFQHRRITPGINILLVDYNKPMKKDRMLPVGRLRENPGEAKRAGIIIITKCPAEITPINRRILEKDVHLFPYQELFFTTMVYGQLYPVFPQAPKMDLFTDIWRMGILLVTGIASPEPVIRYINSISAEVDTVTFPDHHYFTGTDIHQVIQKFYRLQSSHKIIVTTEKDVVRIVSQEGLSPEVKSSMYYLPVQVKFLDREGKLFDKKILDYVGENKSNRALHIRKNRNSS
jgi:tetraacyldisaccharide 4'-kinase